MFQAIKCDVIRSLLSRVELLCEDFATNEEEQCELSLNILNCLNLLHNEPKLSCFQMGSCKIQ